MTLEERLENIAMTIIANAGAARTAAFEALAKAKANFYENAAELLKRSDDYACKAHSAHSVLLEMYSKGEVKQVDILLTHAQDHLMNALLAKELIAEIIEIRENMDGRCKNEDSAGMCGRSVDKHFNEKDEEVCRG